MKIAVASLALSLAACSERPVDIRACNDTGHDMSRLTYSTFDEGPLANGECTEYRQVEHDLYSYTYVDFQVGADHFTIQPIDFVGEDPLPGGAWSYRIGISDFSARSATIAAVED